MEALGLGNFMVSACFFTALFEHPDASLHHAIPNANIRLLLIALAMSGTALFIFYSPYTSPSGSYINPAVTLVHLHLKKINSIDAFFYILFQLIGGTAAVYLMAYLMGHWLTDSPINYVVTVPGKDVTNTKAALVEFFTAFLMITMVLQTASHVRLQKYTRLFAGMLVFFYVLLAGPVSGFGMNPARSFASALPANIWTSFWIYILCPIIGMHCASQLFVLQKKKN